MSTRAASTRGAITAARGSRPTALRANRRCGRSTTCTSGSPARPPPTSPTPSSTAGRSRRHADPPAFPSTSPRSPLPARPTPTRCHHNPRATSCKCAGAATPRRRTVAASRCHGRHSARRRSRTASSTPSRTRASTSTSRTSTSRRTTSTCTPSSRRRGEATAFVSSSSSRRTRTTCSATSAGASSSSGSGTIPTPRAAGENV